MTIVWLMFQDKEVWLIIFLGFFIVREMVRKGIALYKAWEKKDKIWFVILFLINSCGILPIAYLILNKKKNGWKTRKLDLE